MVPEIKKTNELSSIFASSDGLEGIPTSWPREGSIGRVQWSSLAGERNEGRIYRIEYLKKRADTERILVTCDGN
jgi:hypothetical protein